VSTALAVAGGLFLAIYGPLALLGFRRPLLGRLAVREACRRRGQSALLVAGLLVGSAAFTASLIGGNSSVTRRRSTCSASGATSTSP
jgi:hypothetical protein